MISAQLLGGASLRSGDTPVNGPPAQRHRIALLTMVAAAWPQPISRDRAMTLLWPERDVTNARRLLNLAVHVLRSALGDDVILSAGDGLLFNPTTLRCDLHELRTAIASGADERVVKLYTGPLLDGFHLDDSTEFSYWLDERRNELAHGYVAALLALAERQEAAGDVHSRVGTCRRLVAADPHSAAHAQALMRALDAAGDRAGALRHAGDHARRLREDLDLPPDHDVATLAEELRTAKTKPASSQPTATRDATRDTTRDATRDVKRDTTRAAAVAVLPFLNLSADADNAYFADGITEDVIAHVSKIRALRVISRASVMRFKERLQSLQEIAHTLGATTLLDGSVRRAGDRVRVVATLLDAPSGEQLWSETYDRELTDIFAIQTDVALHIAAALEAELSGEEQTRVRREPTRDMQAYYLYLQGRQWQIRYTPEAVARAIGFFERAIERDPDFALAHAALAMLHVQMVEDGAVPPAVAFEHARASVTTSLRLDPDLDAAHYTLGHLRQTSDFDWAGAEQSFRRALDLNPSNADACNLYGRICASLGRYDEAVALHERAQVLDPLAHRLDVATTLLRAGRYDEAVQRAELATELEPEYDRARATLGWAYILSGRMAEGVAELERAVAAGSGRTLWLGQLGEAYALAGDEAKARAVLRELEARSRDGYVSSYHFAYVYAGLGDADRALAWLERAVAERTGAVHGIRGSFLFASLQEHPRFRALLRRINLD